MPGLNRARSRVRRDNGGSGRGYEILTDRTVTSARHSGRGVADRKVVVSMDRYASGESWLVWVARRFGFGRNPLRRHTDRIESAIFLSALLVAVLVVPAAVAVGTAVQDASERAAAQRRAVLTEAPATTLEEVQSWSGAGSGVVMSWAKVGWTDADGLPREGWSSVPIGTTKGSEVTIWLDPSGAISAPPRQPGESEAIGGAVGLTAAMVAWLVLIGLTRLAQVWLDRRRSRDLDREWEQTDHRWRHHES